ncbi:AAA family ATPase [Hallella multisaccharivorax]|uniref:AAA family ATPase n=1 Tax=Hallella multisaccharivorax TaxID=310514 RepID=UPI003612CB36
MDIKIQILNRTRQGLDVFHHYLNVKFVPNRNFKNPLYNDTRASCSVYLNKKTGIYMMKDFGNIEYSGDCFWLVAKLLGLDMKHDFKQILWHINEDMGLCIPMGSSSDGSNGYGQKFAAAIQASKPNSSELEPESKVNAEELPPAQPNIKLVYKELSEEELKYWGRYGIKASTLKRFKVRSAKSLTGVTKEGKTYKICSQPTEPMFVYHTIDEAVKVYMPKSKLRFMYAHRPSGEYVYGLEHLPSRGHMVFITGGEKDVMSLAAHGFNAVCFNSETIVPPLNIIENLHRRFKHIVLLYDMDDTGRRSAAKIEQALNNYHVKRLELPLSGIKSEKDISDFFAIGHTTDELSGIITELIQKIYRKSSVIFKSCELDYDNPPEKSSSVVEVNDVPVGTCDNLFCLTGGEGVGKSNFVAAIISGTIAESALDAERTLGLTIIPNPSGRAVILFDTEQSEHQLYKNVRKAVKRAYLDDKPDFFHAYHLSEQSRKERLDIIRTALDMNFHKHKGIQLVIIDGVADLVRSANDELESVEVIDELYRLAGFYHCCVVCVLHFVPNGIKLRGHIGSELQRKAAGILSIEKDVNPAFSVVKCIKVRDGSPLDIPMMSFGWDKKEDMFVYMGVKSKEDKEKQKSTDLRNIAASIFEKADSLTYGELTDAIVDMMEVKPRTAKEYIRYMREKAIIEQLADQTYQLKIF